MRHRARRLSRRKWTAWNFLLGKIPAIYKKAQRDCWKAHETFPPLHFGNNQRATRSIQAVPIKRKTARKKSVVSSPRR